MIIAQLTNYLVPAQAERIPITFTAIIHLPIPFFLLLTMAYLARRPDTLTIRLSLLPFTFATVVRASYGYDSGNPLFNFLTALGGLFSAGKAVEWGLSPKGILKCGESQPGSFKMAAASLCLGPNGKSSRLVKEDTNGSIPKERPPSTWTSFIGAVGEGWELMCAARGLGWEFGTGTGIVIPEEIRDTSNRRRFLLQTGRTIAVHALIGDFIVSTLKLVPGVGSPSGGSIFAFGSNFFEKYAISTVLHLTALCGILIGFELTYNSTTLFFVAILGDNPAFWPPLQIPIWTSTSLHEFWGKRWHQLIRRTILVFGGYPLHRLFGLPGLVIGSFLASGYFHSWALYSAGKGTDNVVVLFFLLQAVGMVGERLWRDLTGRRVCGWQGWLYAALFLIFGGQLCTNAYILRGTSGAIPVPKVISPTRSILFPLLGQLYERYSPCK